MPTKFCPACSTEKATAEFGRHRTRYDGLQPQCRECKRVMQRQWYHRNKTRHVENVNRRSRAVEAEIIKKVIVYLRQNPCVDCGESNPVLLEFDHVRGDKRGSICDLISRGCGWETVAAEIRKCEVRCCKCHRLKTARQFGYRKLLLSSTS